MRPGRTPLIKETYQTKLKSQLVGTGIPARQILVMGYKVVITAPNRPSFDAWRNLLYKFAVVRKYDNDKLKLYFTLPRIKTLLFHLKCLESEKMAKVLNSTDANCIKSNII